MNSHRDYSLCYYTAKVEGLATVIPVACSFSTIATLCASVSHVMVTVAISNFGEDTQP